MLLLYLPVPSVLDRFDPEPWWCLAMAFFWGAIVATGVAGFAKGGAKVALVQDGAETVMSYDVKAQVGGKIAQLGARLIDNVLVTPNGAERLTKSPRDLITVS